MALVTRFWRVIIAPIMAWHLQCVIRAMTQVILAYRYCAFGDADFGVRHMRFKPGDRWVIIAPIMQAALTRRYCAFGRGLHRAIISIILVFAKRIKANSNELNLVKAKLNSHQFILLH